ncbi:MAG TPA: hypothetical protein VD770_03195, partial [Coxiellaceae bacterium]|nr:hypothetical protein [Coxiellaceae bacterium]
MRDSIIAEYTDAKYTVERLQTYRPRCSPTSLRPHERFRALLESLDSSLDLRKEALTKLENELSMLNTKIFPSPEKMTDAEAAELSASLAEIFNKITQIQYLDSLHFPAAFHEGLRKKLLNPLAVINETLQAIQKGYQT